MSEPTEGLTSSGPAQDAIPDPVDERAPFEPDGNVATIIFSRIADVQTRAALTMASRSWRDASRLLASLPKHNNGRLNLDGLSETQIDHLVDVYGLTSLDEERMLAVAGVDKEDFCEWAATRTGCLKLIVWALERGFSWGGYPPGLVSDDVLALRMTRAMCPELQDVWREDESSHTWRGVTWANSRVDRIELSVNTVPACIGQFSLLRDLLLNFGRITSLPPAIGKLTNLKLLSLFNDINGDSSEYVLESLPAEIGQLTSLEVLSFLSSRLTSLPATIGQLTSLKRLQLAGNQLTSLPAEVRQLRSLERLNLGHNQLTTLPEWIGELTSLKKLTIYGNQLTSLPAAAIDGLRARGCNVED